MKPIRLNMKAFGPYAGEETLDFANLKGRNFFLIHGPTGAGKTSILDAICFALFGDSSGDERKSKQMRSDHAEQSLSTEVTFEFALGSETYRVTRSPEQERAARRGNATVTTKGQATLWKLNDKASQPIVLAAKPSDVTEKVEQLLGFKSNQFRQVVLLPQGKFRQLITSNSNEREAILEALFKTEIYRRIEEALKQKASGVGDEIKENKARQSLILEQAGVGCLEEVDKKRQSINLQLEQLQGKLTELKANEASKQQALNDAREIVKKLDEAGEALVVFTKLSDEKETFANKQLELDGARRAQGLFNIETVLKKRAEESEQAKQKHSRAKEALVGAENTSQEKDALLQAELGKQSQRDEAAKKLHELTQLTDKVRELDSAQKIVSVTERQFRQAEASRQALNQEMEDLQLNLDKTQEKVLALEVTAAKSQAFELTLKSLEQSYRDRQRVEDLRAELSAKMQVSDEGLACLTALSNRIKEARHELDLLEQHFAQSQAANLSSKLVSGEPCLVCGSTVHPKPAAVEGQLPTESILKSKRDEIRQLESSLSELTAENQNQVAAIAKIQAEEASLAERLGELSSIDLKDLQLRVDQARRTFTEANNSNQLAQKAQLELAACKSSIEEKKTQFSDMEMSLSEAKANYERARAVVIERVSQIPADLQDSMLLEKTIRQAEEKNEQLRRAFEGAQNAARQAAESFAASKTGLFEAVELQTTTENRLQSQKQEFLMAMKEAGFTTLQEFKDARRAVEKIAVLDTEIARFQADLAAAEDRHKRASSLASGFHRPNLVEFETAYASAKEQTELVVREEVSLSEKLKQIQVWLNELSKVGREIERLETRYGVVGRLADVASGRNAFGVTFQRFVLGALLDDVLIASSQRLRIMSKGRYQLQRMSGRQDKRTAGGLDLEVYDTYTGTTRPVATLSGGESFIASLSMALGLADVVQSYAGGVYLETIFVDEGFGSLDPESLDLALRALIDLQQGGRLVGIISHVPELKERIDARLEVVPGRSGSSARFVVA